MIVNLTARIVRIYAADRADGIDDLDLGLRHTFDPDPPPVRLDPLPLVAIEQDGVPVQLMEYGHADNLPAALDGRFLVVPPEVALAHHPRRSDLLTPHQPVTTADGTVVGYRSLAQPV